MDNAAEIWHRRFLNYANKDCMKFRTKEVSEKENAEVF